MSSSLNADEFLKFASAKMPHGNILDVIERKTVNQEKNDVLWDMKIGRITTSEVSEVARYTPKGLNKLKNRILGYSSCHGSQAIKREIRLQNQVINEVSRQLNTHLSTCGLMLDPQFPVIGASPDAVGPNFVVDIKCPISEKNFQNYLYVKLDPNTGSNLKPEFYAQIQLQMHFRKVLYGYFVIANPEFESNQEVNIIKIDYNEDYTKNLLNRAIEFWKEHIFPEMLRRI